MEWPNGKFLAILLNAHEVCAIENKSGRLLGRFPYPAAFLPAALLVDSAGQSACLALRKDTTGAICLFNLRTMRGYRLPVELPAPLQFTATSDFKHAFFSSADATLYHLDLTTLQYRAIARPEQASCVGIAVRGQFLYSAWETDGGGSLVICDLDGALHSETQLDAIPTNLCLNGSTALIPFTESLPYGEGFAVIDENTAPRYHTIQNLGAPGAPHIYPCSITLDPKQSLAYLVHEDGGSISIIETADYTVHTTFPLGRSISTLYLLPDTRFALAASNMFADLTLVDLINRRLLSVNDSAQEFAGFLAMLG